MMVDVGVVGLGKMGGGIARRLLDAGHRVRGYNRTQNRASALVGRGLELMPTPKDVATASDVVFSMVRDSEALMAVARGERGIIAGLSPGKIYADMSTVSPQASRQIEAEVRAAGAQMLDAPVSGSVATLEAGELTFMVGGDADVFERIKPVLLEIGARAIHVGANGQAVLMKIATNLCVAVQMLAFSEAVLLAETAGIDRGRAIDVLLNSVIASPMLKYRGAFVLEMPETAWFDVEMMRKDLRLALEAGSSLGVPLPSTAATKELLNAAFGLGFGDRDFAVIYQVLARISSPTARVSEHRDVT